MNQPSSIATLLNDKSNLKLHLLDEKRAGIVAHTEELPAGKTPSRRKSGHAKTSPRAIS